MENLDATVAKLKAAAAVGRARALWAMSYARQRDQFAHEEKESRFSRPEEPAARQAEQQGTGKYRAQQSPCSSESDSHRALTLPYKV